MGTEYICEESVERGADEGECGREGNVGCVRREGVRREGVKEEGVRREGVRREGVKEEYEFDVLISSCRRLTYS